MKKTMNEAVQVSETDYSVVDVQVADAIRTAEANKGRAEEAMNKKFKMPNEDRDAHADIKSEGMKKMYLSESLFTEFVEDEKPLEEAMWKDSQYDDEEDKAFAEEQTKEYFKDVEMGYGWVTIDKAVEDLNNQGILVTEENIVEYVNDNSLNIMNFEDIAVVLTPTAPSREEICKDLGVEYDHIDEQLTEDFSSSLPQWLRKKYIAQALYKKKGVDLANVEYVGDVLPANARDKRVQDSTKISCFLLKPRYGGEFVWVKGLNDDDYLDLGDGYRAIKYYSMKTILDHAIEYGYIDLTDEQNRVGGLQRMRKDRQRGVVNRQKTAQFKREVKKYDYEKGEQLPSEYQWITQRGYDKSGYALNPMKYKNKLEDVGYDNYQERLEKYHNRIEKVREGIIELLTNYNIKTGLRTKSSWSDDLDDIVRTFTRVTEEYKNILKELDRVLSKNWNDDADRDYYFKAIFNGDGYSGNIRQLRKYLEEVEKLLRETNENIKAQAAKEAEEAAKAEVAEEPVEEAVKSLKEDFNASNIDHYEILDWLSEHETAYEDAKAFFGEDKLPDVTSQELVDWIFDHEQLFTDFEEAFKDQLIVEKKLTEGVREVTNQLLDMVDNGMLDARALAVACLKYMSEYDVRAMAIANEFIDNNSEELEEGCKKVTEDWEDENPNSVRLLQMVDDKLIAADSLAQDIIHYLADDNKVGEFCKQSEYFWDMIESAEDDKIAIQHYEVDILDTLHFLADAYLEGRVAAGPYARGLRKAYNTLEEIEVDAKQHEDDNEVVEGCEDKTLNEYKRPEGAVLKYKKKREPLADIIQQELTDGEWGYVESPDGRITPTNMPSANYLPDHVGIAWDKEDRCAICVWGASEAELQAAVDIAKKYGKEYKLGFDKYVAGDKKHYIYIYVDEDKDFDEPYFNPNDPVVDTSKKSKKVDDDDDIDDDMDESFNGDVKDVILEEVDDVTEITLIPEGQEDAITEGVSKPVNEDVVVEGKQPLEEIMISTEGLRNFKPWDGAKATYNTVLEHNKLDTLEFMLEDMYPNGIGASELNDLLWFQKDWVLEMLGIGVEKEDFSQVEVTGEVPEEPEQE